MFKLKFQDGYDAPELADSSKICTHLGLNPITFGLGYIGDPLPLRLGTGLLEVPSKCCTGAAARCPGGRQNWLSDTFRATRKLVGTDSQASEKPIRRTKRASIHQTRRRNKPAHTMVIKIRLARFGRRNLPFYNIVVAHARYAQSTSPTTNLSSEARDLTLLSQRQHRAQLQAPRGHWHVRPGPQGRPLREHRPSAQGHPARFAARAVLDRRRRAADGHGVAAAEHGRHPARQAVWPGQGRGDQGGRVEGRADSLRGKRDARHFQRQPITTTIRLEKGLDG